MRAKGQITGGRRRDPSDIYKEPSKVVYEFDGVSTATYLEYDIHYDHILGWRGCKRKRIYDWGDYCELICLLELKCKPYGGIRVLNSIVGKGKYD